MSIKGFHIVFVSMATLLCAFLCVWAFVIAVDSSTIMKVLGFVGVLGLLIFPVYGITFYRKIVKNSF